jgi:hypothetical protein
MTAQSGSCSIIAAGFKIHRLLFANQLGKSIGVAHAWLKF